MSVRKLKSSKSRSFVIPSAQETAELEKTRRESVVMKAKIRSLELEVDTLKQRLESLRKAKNTTIIKREREEIHIQAPNLGRHYSNGTDISCLSRTSLHYNNQSEAEEKQLLQEQLAEKEKLLLEKREEIQELSSKLTKNETNFEEKLVNLRQEHEEIVKNISRKLSETEDKLAKEMEQAKELHIINVKCTVTEDRDELLKEIERLKSENEELASHLTEVVNSNVQLRESNLVLQGKCETLLEDLSVKEARWSEREERLHAEICKQWGERYHEWITKAEKKMEELQKVNVMLQSLLKTKAHNPDL